MDGEPIWGVSMPLRWIGELSVLDPNVLVSSGEEAVKLESGLLSVRSVR